MPTPRTRNSTKREKRKLDEISENVNSSSSESFLQNNKSDLSNYSNSPESLLGIMESYLSNSLSSRGFSKRKFQELFDSVESGYGADSQLTVHRFILKSNHVTPAGYICSILLLEGFRSLPYSSLSSDHIMTSLIGEFHHRSLRFIHNPGEIKTNRSEYGKESVQNYPQCDYVNESLETVCQCSVNRGRYLRIVKDTFFTCRACERVAILHLVKLNSDVTALTLSAFKMSHITTFPEAKGSIFYTKPDEIEEIYSDLYDLLVKSQNETVDSKVRLKQTAVEIFESFLESKKAELANVMKQRWPAQVLASEDWVYVRKIGEALALFVAHGGTLKRDLVVEKVYSILAGEQKLFMTRVHYQHKNMKDCPYQLRIHLFEDATEDVPHNHNGNAMSMALVGSYTHTSFCLKKIPNFTARVPFRVLQNNALSDVQEYYDGALEMVDQHCHKNHNVYYLAQSTLHSVLVDPAAALRKVVTLFVKDKSEGITRFFAPSSNDLQMSTMVVEIKEDNEKASVLQEIQELIKNSVNVHL